MKLSKDVEKLKNRIITDCTAWGVGYMDKQMKKLIDLVEANAKKEVAKSLRLTINSWISTDKKGKEYIDEVGLIQIANKLDKLIKGDGE
jgi:hypothetical protein